MSGELPGLFGGRTGVTPTVEFAPLLPLVELKSYRFHVRSYGAETSPPLIVVHCEPGGNSGYLKPIRDLAKDNYVIFHDEHGTGLPPRVKKDTLTLESSPDDLHANVDHYDAQGPV